MMSEMAKFMLKFMGCLAFAALAGVAVSLVMQPFPTVIAALPAAQALPGVYLGEIASNEELLVKFEFYVDGHDLDPSTDVLAPFDIVNLTPNIAKCKPAPTPTNGCIFQPQPNGIGLAVTKVIYGSPGHPTFEKLLSVQVVPEGSVTLRDVHAVELFTDIYD